MDTLSPQRRSWLMARIKPTGNRSTEQQLLALLRQQRITGWRRGYPLVGRPDFTFPRARVAVFVDGCFWHGHPRRCRLPRANRAYWRAKIARNQARDRLVNRALKQRGWQVVRIWEHCVARPATLARLRRALAGGLRDGANL